MNLPERLCARLLDMPYFRGRDRLVSLVRRLLRPGMRSLPAGFRMFLDPGEWTQFQLLLSRDPEPLTTQLCRELLDTGATFIDIGAHVGWYSCLAASIVGPTGRIIAIEPQPVNLDALRQSVAENGFTQVITVAAAAGDREQARRLPTQSRQDTARLTLLGPGVNDTGDSFETRERRLDGLMDEVGVRHIRLLKIDVEGYELEVLRGCGDHLRQVDHIILELLPGLPAPRRTALHELLQAQGFTTRLVTGAPCTPALSDYSKLPEDNLWATRTTPGIDVKDNPSAVA